MINRLYYYRYNKLKSTVTLVETGNSNKDKEIVDNERVYCTYSQKDKAIALIDIMEYINKYNIENIIYTDPILIKII